jgi:hypothetical protein
MHIDNHSLRLYKIVRDTKLWKKGQRVWVIYETGALAAFVKGKYKGKGRWLKAWIRYDEINPTAKSLGEVEVTEKFYNFIHKTDPPKYFHKIDE